MYRSIESTEKVLKVKDNISIHVYEIMMILDTESKKLSQIVHKSSEILLF